MSIVIREGDVTIGEGYNPTFVPQGTSTGSLNSVFIGGIGVVCQGDSFVAHSNSSGDSHTPVAGLSGSKVFIGPARKEVFTVTSTMNTGCGATMAPVIGTVLAG
jgi:hypothetical protein